MNILELQQIWETFRLHLPMLVCGIWVTIIHRKIIWSTLKEWWSWQKGWGLQKWTKERLDYLVIFGLMLASLIFTFSTSNIRQKLETKQQTELIEKTLEEKLVTKEELEKNLQKVQEQKQKLGGRKKVSLPLYHISPLLSFLFICIIAPLGEESVFRYLIFEIFNKNNPFAYLLSGTGFIFLHWLGPAGGLFNFTTIGLLLLSYLPMTIVFIYSYRKSKWNITYPIYFHFLWNFLNFLLVIIFNKT